MKFRCLLAILVGCFSFIIAIGSAMAQEESSQPSIQIETGGDRNTYVGKTLSFDIGNSQVSDGVNIKEVLWNFGDATSTTGDKVTHTYKNAGIYTVRVNVTTDNDSIEKSLKVHVLKYVMVLLADNTISTDQTNTFKEQAATENILLVTLRAQDGGPEAVTEEELTNVLLDAREDVDAAQLIISSTSGSVGANVLSKFAQHIKQASGITADLTTFSSKGVVMLSDTPFAVLAPAAQSSFDQFQPAYVLLTRPEAIKLLLHPLSAEEAKNAILSSSISHRLLGTFSTRTMRDVGPTNFLSFGINFLVNQGVPINNITLILMLPIIATILSFSRQVIGIKAFGIITPALTTLTFLVMGLPYGLIVFSTVLLSGTLTRLLVRRLHLLYLPRMALVLTNVSLAILALLGVGTIAQGTAALSFSIFPILILTLLAEDFIAAQFNSGARTAFTITAWTLLLSIGCYFIVSWQLLRTVIISYPEIVILCIPLNILLGRWTGLRLTEYMRFRNLVRHSQ